MQELSSKNIIGALSRLDGEINASAVHKYTTSYGPGLGEDEIEDQYQNLDGVIEANIADISEGCPRYRVEVHLEKLDTAFNDEYQRLLNQTS